MWMVVLFSLTEFFTGLFTDRAQTRWPTMKWPMRLFVVFLCFLLGVLAALLTVFIGMVFYAGALAVF